MRRYFKDVCTLLIAFGLAVVVTWLITTPRSPFMPVLRQPYIGGLTVVGILMMYTASLPLVDRIMGYLFRTRS